MVKPHKPAPHVALYVRLSPRPDGVYEGVDDQEKWGRAYAAVHWPGVPIVVYSDAGKSASKEDVTRDGYEGLKTAIRAGAVRHLWAVEQTRLTRRETEWFALAGDLDAAGIAEVHTDRDGILRVGDEVAGIRAVISAGETRRLRGRVRDKMVANAADGKPHGVCPYGYRRIYDERTRRFVRQDIYEPEARHVRELFDRLHKGHSLHAIADDFAARGVLNRSGKPFSRQHLRDMALRACYAGFRVHQQGQHHPGRWRDDAVKTTWWEPIVLEDVFHDVRRMLTASDRNKSRPGRARYLLSMIAVCHVCSEPLGPARKHGRDAYRCNTGSHVLIRMDQLDPYVTDVMVKYLARDDLYEGWARVGAGEELAHVRGELARIRGELAEAEAQQPRSIAEATMFARVVDGLQARVQELADQERELTVPPPLRALAGPDAASRWGAAVLSTQREAARYLLVPERVGQVRVDRWPAHTSYAAKVTAEDRVVWDRLSDAAGSEHDGP